MAGALPNASSAVPASRLQLHLACQALKRMDTFSKSDPCELSCRFVLYNPCRFQAVLLDVVVQLRTNKAHPWLEVGCHP